MSYTAAITGVLILGLTATNYLQFKNHEEYVAKKEAELSLLTTTNETQKKTIDTMIADAHEAQLTSVFLQNEKSELERELSEKKKELNSFKARQSVVLPHPDWLKKKANAAIEFRSTEFACATGDRTACTLVTAAEEKEANRKALKARLQREAKEKR